MIRKTLTALFVFALAAQTGQAGLVGYWTFDDDSCNDSSGNGYNGTLVGGSYTNDVPAALAGGNAVDLSAGDHYVVIDQGVTTGSPEFNFTTSMTVACWIKGWPDGSWEPFISKYGEGANGWQLRRYSSESRVGWTTRNLADTSEDTPGTTTAAADGNWHHIAATYDGVRKRIYVDGVLDMAVRLSEPINGASEHVAFGARQTGGAGGAYGSFARIKMDEVAIFNQALAPNQIAQLAAGVSATNLQEAADLTYDFEDGTLQGWRNTLKSSDPGGFTEFGATNALHHWGAYGVRGLPYVDNNWDDYAQTMMLRSPRFKLTQVAELSAWLYAGNGLGTGSPTDDSGWPAGSDNSSGLLRLCLRRCSDGRYVLSTGKANDGAAWERVSFSSNALAPHVSTDETYTLDLVDQQHGSWGWIAMDDVVIPGEESTEPSGHKIQFDCSDDQGWYLGANSPAHQYGDMHASERTWNMVEGDTTNGLVWADGTAADGVEVDVGASAGGGGAINWATGLNAASTGVAVDSLYDAHLMRDWFYTSGSADLGWRVKGLPAGDYRVYALVREANELGRLYSVDIGINLSQTTASAQSIADATGYTKWAPGRNYAAADVTVTSTDDYVTIIVTPVSEEWGTLEGIQIVPLFDNDGNYNYRMRIDFDGYAGTEVLTNFPVLVKLSESIPGFDYETIASDAGDLRFVWSNGVDELSYDIEQWNPAGTSYVWVRVPQLTAAGSIHAYWGHPTRTTPPYYRDNGSTWLQGYSGVWHLNEAAATDDALDVSSDDNDGVPTASPPVASGLIAGGRAMTGSQKFSVGSALDISYQAFTLSSWAYRTGGGASDNMWFGGGINSNNKGLHCGFRFQSPNDKIWFGLYGDDGNCATDYSGDAGAWHHYTWVMDSAHVKHIYRDGVAVPVTGSNNNFYQSTGIELGANRATPSYRGTLDEVRVSSGVARSADWINAEWLNSASNAQFQTYVDVEPLLTYTVTVAQATGGVIAPDTVVTGYLQDVSYTITPQTGYHIAELLVDGVSVAPSNSYAFLNLTASHTLSARFVPWSVPHEADAIGLGAWFNADAMGSLTDGQAVTSWYDLSGNGRHATQASAGNRPTFVTNAVNGKPVMRFNGTSSVLGYDGTFLAGTDYTVFIVEARASGKSNSFLMGGTQGAADSNLHVGYRDGTTFTHAHYSRDYNMAVPAFSTKEFTLWSLHLDNTGGTGRETYRDGTKWGSTTAVNTLLSYTGAQLGRYSTINYYEGDIAEVLIYDRYLSIPQRNRVGYYLSQKYGVTSDYKDPSAAELALTYGCNRDLAAVGDAITYTITVLNNGYTNATSLVISNALPATLQFDSASSGDYNDTTGDWTIGTLEYLASTTLTVTATVKASAAGTTVATAAGIKTVTQPDWDSANNAGAHVLNVRDEVQQADFAHRLRIDFSGYDKDEVLTNFPALVVLSEALNNFDYDLFASPQGYDLRFVSSNGTTVLYHDVEKWNTSGESHFWVQVDAISSNAYIWAYWGNPALTTRPAFTTNGLTWAEGFEGVWHMAETSASADAADASPEENDGAAVGSPTLETGVVDGARGMVGVEAFSVNTTLDLSNKPFTLDVWAKRTLDSTGDNMWGGGGVGGTAGYGLHCGFRNDNLRFALYGDDIASDDAYAADRDQWHYYSMVMDASHVKTIYRDGVRVPCTGPNNGFYKSQGLLIGGTYGGNPSFKGALDEMRASSGVARSSNWVWATYMNIASNDVFGSYGTAIGPPALATRAPSNITDEAVFMNGTLSFTGSVPTTVYLVWGESSGGTTWGAWAHTNAFGQPPLGPLTTNITGLTQLTTYHYTYYATNAYGATWAAQERTFATAASVFYNISPSAGPNGTIDPNIAEAVNENDDSSVYTFAPDFGYHLTNVVIDGTPIGVTNQYQFVDVTTNHTIQALFGLNQYTVTVTQVANGTISPDDPVVFHGSDQAFSIRPDDGYYVSDVRVDGASVGPVRSWTIEGITNAHTLTASYTALPANLVTNNMVLWLDAGTIGAPSNAAPVAAWKDYSGLGNHASQSGATFKPHWYDDRLGPHVYFDGTADFMTVANESNFDFETNMAYFMVFKHSGPGTQAWRPVLCKNGEASGWQLREHSDSSGISFTTRGLTGGDTDNPQGAGNITQDCLVAGEYAGATRTKRLWYNGSPDGTLTYTGGTISTNNDPVILGARFNGGINSWAQCDVYEALIYSEPLNAIERNAVGHYLQTKYGLAGEYRDPAATYTITVTQASGGGGEIAPDGTAVVTAIHDSGVYSMTASNGYYLAELVVDGQSVAPAATYHFTEVATNHTLSATFLPYPTYLPTDGLSAWFSADAMTTRTNDESVASWHDLSGSGRHATQGTTVNRPVYLTDIVNGLPVVHFDGTNGVLSYDGTFLADTDYTVFIVEGRTSGTNSSFMLGGTQSATDRNLHIGYRTTSQLTHAHFGRDYNMNVPAFTTQAFKLWSMHLDYTGESGRATYMDGALLGSSTQTNKLLSYTGAQIGRYSTGNYFQGDIAEILIYNRYLDTVDRNRVGYYLEQKYAIDAAYENPTEIDIGVTIGADLAQADVGDTVIYTITAVNNGPTNASSVIISNMLPASVDYVTHAGGTYNDATGEWSIDSLDYLASTTLTVTATFNAAAAGQIVTTAAGLKSSGQTDWNPANDDSDVWTRIRDEVAPADFACRLRIDFGAYDKAEPLTNFPALVVLNESLHDFAYGQFASPSGYDLRFVAANGTTVLYHEVEQWNTTGDSVFWVQLPTLETGTYIWAYWGNPAATTQPAYTTNGLTWHDEFKGVWHMTETNAVDSTANANNAAQGGTLGVTLTAAGKIGPALTFPGGAGAGSHGYLDVPYSDSLRMGNTFTFSAWARHDRGNADGHQRLASKKTSYDAGSGWHVTRHSTIDNDIDVRGSSGTVYNPLVTASWAAGNWEYITIVYSNATATAYSSGRLVGSGAITPVTDADVPLVIGNNASHNEWNWQGPIDELRVEDTLRSSNWVWATYMNMASNAAFGTYGPVVGPPLIDNLAATNITDASAFMNGNLSFTGAVPTTVYLLWGESDQGQVWGAWANTNTFGARATGSLTTNITSLADLTTYQYTYYATNDYGTAWGSPSRSFVTLSGTFYTITPSAGPHGAIDPSAAENVSEFGSSSAFTFAPDPGYHLTNVVVDGSPIGVTNSYQFTNVSDNHSIQALFGINQYTVTVTQATGGTVTPTGNVLVNHGANQAFTIAPDEGYYVTNVIVDGTALGPRLSYTFAGVTAGHSITAEFAPLPYGMVTDDLVLWLDASRLSTVDGGAVSNWVDYSGLRNNASQNGAGFKPLYHDSELGPHVTFDGSDDFMTIANEPTFDFTNNVTILLVGRHTTSAGWMPYIAKNGEPSGWQFREYGGNNHISLTLRGLTGAGTDGPEGTGDIQLNSIQAGRYTGDTRVSEAWYNGASQGSLTYTGGTISTNNDPVLLGASYNGGVGGYANCDIYELLIFRGALTDRRLNSVGFYLATKYGLSSNYTDPLKPTVANTSASEIRTTTARLGGELVSTGSAPTTVWAYWDTTDRGTNAGAWTGSVSLGPQPQGAVAADITGLTGDTTYYYRLRGVNAYGQFWSPTATRFDSGVNPHNYDYRMKIRLKGYAGSATLTDFPMLVRFGSHVPEFSYATFAAPHGNDLRFMDAHEERTLNYEVENWVTRLTSQDIGYVGAVGASSYTGTEYTVQGSGGDIWDLADEFHYAYTRLSGDGSITVRVKDISNPGDNEWCKVGVMIRENLYADTRYAFMMTRPDGQTRIQYRLAAGETSYGTGLNAGPIPGWLRLVRIGDMFYGYASPDGQNWTLNAQQSVPMAPSVLIGLAVTSHADGTLTTVTFDHVGISVSDTSHVWVQVPEVASADNYIWAFWGNDAVNAPLPCTTNGATWNSDYVAVWHMVNSNAVDSTVNDHDGTANGNVATAGMIDGAQSFANTGELTVDSRIDLRNRSFTFSAWALHTATGDNDFLCGQGATGDMLHIGFRDSNAFTFAFWGDDLNNGAWTDTTTWHYWSCVYTAATRRQEIFRDGVSIASRQAGEHFTGSGVFRLGARGDSSYNYQGSMDETRLNNANLSSDWIAAEYENQRIGSDFLEYGDAARNVSASIFMFR